MPGGVPAVFFAYDAAHKNPRRINSSTGGIDTMFA